MKGRKILLFSVLLILQLLCHSSETLNLQSEKSSYSLKHSLIFNAGNNDIKPEQVVRFLNDNVFTFMSGNLNKGFSHDVYWLAFTLKNETSEINWTLETGPSSIEELEYYFLDEFDGNVFRISTENKNNCEWTNIHHALSITHFKLQKGETRTILLKVKSYPVQLSAKIMPRSSNLNNYFLEFSLRGMYYGLLLCLVITSLFSFILNRRKEYILYFIYLLAFSFFQLSHDGYLLQTGIDFAINRKLIIIAESLCIISGLFFQRTFIGSRLRRVSNVLFNVLISFSILLILSTFFIPLIYFVYLSVVSASLIIVFSFNCLAVALIQKNNPNDHVYTYHSLAWIFLFSGFSIFSLKQFGLLPLNLITRNSIHFASVAEFIFLSFALAEREKHLHLEKEKTLFLENKNKTLLSLSTTDSLTGLYNRMRSEDILTSEIKESERYNYPLCMAFLDIDYFKKINDTFGHPAGDSVLKEFATILSENIRQSDYAGRWGGEEFILIIPHSRLYDAIKMSEKLIQIIREYPFPAVGHCTASLGITQLKPGEKKQDFIKRVDQLLYASKDRGRNRVSS